MQVQKLTAPKQHQCRDTLYLKKNTNMKKILLALTLLLTIPAIYAQDAEKTAMTKEKKAELKKLKAEHLAASFSEAGLSEEQVAQSKAAIEAAMEKSNALKAETALSESEKEAKKAAINAEKNTRLKEIMADKYKTWNEIRKKQKAVEEAFVVKP